MEYVFSCLDRCRFGVNKPTCKQCPTHCYRPKMRERIRTLMRWSGP
ncbi:MAG: nitrous oxide-stimulated promoter family protein [Bacteroidales bacterium]|nr:nitrous oxide-stimulated promoter family protein [Bacteroidales bacterium]